MSSSTHCPPRSDELSDDLIYEVLLRLPVKSLLRFKAVSKPWCCLISSPAFVKSHQARPGSYATLVIHGQEKDDLSLFSLFSFGPNQLVKDLKCPYSNKKFPDSKIVGCDRGIVCVVVNINHSSDGYYFSDRCYLHEAHCPTSIYLWNPATMQYKLIPPHNIFYEYKNTVEVDLGFGFDPIDNDFKVVRFLTSRFATEVYSANMNAWRKVVPQPTEFKNPSDFKVCIDGLLCWTSFDEIFSFDLHEEVFSSVTYNFPVNSYPCITDVNNSIGVILGEGLFTKLWMLDDIECLRGGGVGVEASWTLMLSINANVSVNSVLTYFNNGDLLLMCDDGKWVSYDSNKKEAEEVPIPISRGGVFMYTETLVSITGFNQVK